MRIVPAPITGLSAGRPLPFALRDKSGNLLLARGVVVPSEAHVAALVRKGMWVASEDADAFQRAYAGQLDQMVRNDSALGQIAVAKPDLEAINAAPAASVSRTEDWPMLNRQMQAIFREPAAVDFIGKLETLRADLCATLERSPDRALLALVQMTSQEVSHYASSHALLVAVLCDLMAVKVLKLEPGQRRSLVLAALSMNVSMAALQNLLATQDQPPDPSQRAQIAGHAKQSADMLRNCGVSDEVWLEAVLHHHDAAPGELLARPVGLQCARMIQRADLFAARLSPRRHRRALSAAAAVQIAYLDEQKQPDEAGMALIKATGLYPPGCLVQLASGELGVVAKRGQTADKPVVAVVVGKSGLPIGVPVLRQTSHASHTVVRSLAPHELNVRLNMSEILNLG